MGVLNVTPDSFSDGGRYLDADLAIDHGRQLAREGADIVDVGGESTRPGAEPVCADTEAARVVPVIEGLAGDVRLSIDTAKASVADAAIDAGASLVNDVSASQAGVAAERGVGWVAMHMQGSPRTMQDEPRYRDVVSEVSAFLVEAASAARAAGVEEVWIDPGIGFGKTLAHNLTLVANIDRLVATGYPVVIGPSRKSFLGRLLADSDARSASGVSADPVPTDDRLEGSIATATWAMSQGVGMVRAHDVRAASHAARVVGGLRW